jgi:hypothetical protein
MKPTSSSFLSSSRMKFCRSTDYFWGFYCTSTFSQRKVTSVSFYLSPRFPTMWVVWVASARDLDDLHGTYSSSEGYTRGAEDKTRWRELDGAWSSAPLPAATSWVVASAWSFSSVETPVEWSPRILMMTLGVGIFMTRYP